VCVSARGGHLKHTLLRQLGVDSKFGMLLIAYYNTHCVSNCRKKN